MTQKVLSLVIKVDTDSYSFTEKMPSMLDKILSQTGYDEELIDVLLTQETVGEEALAKCGDLLKDYENAYRLVALGDLNEIVDEKYILILEQGDLIEGDFLEHILKICKKKYGMILLNRKNDKKQPSYFASIYERPFKVQLNADRTVVKRKSISDLKLLFENDLQQTQEVLKLILKQEGFFIDNHALLVTSGRDEEFSYSLTKGFTRELFAYSKEKRGEVGEYLQQCMLAIIDANIAQQGDKHLVEEILPEISDEVIAKYGKFKLATKIYLLNMKYGRNIMEEAEVRDDGKVYFQETLLLDISKEQRLTINITTVKDGQMTLEGTTDLELLGDKYKLYVSDYDDVLYPVELSPFPVNDLVGLDGELYYHGCQFKVSFPIEAENEYELILEDENLRDFRIVPNRGQYSRMNRTAKAYFVEDGFLIKIRDNHFQVEKQHFWSCGGCEILYLLALLKEKKLYTILYRLAYWLVKPFMRKPVWIVADRPHVAKDNGEHMFRYLMQETDASKKYNIYFLISKESKDYERIKEIGKILPHNSLKHHVISLYAKVIIAAAANNLALNAFGNKGGRYYRDLQNFNFVYLRHGVSHNDQSRWLNHLNKNIRILVATCKPEYQGILEGPYGYSDREVRMTGLARYDNLYDERQKIIAILPTWRKNLEGELVAGTSQRAKIPDFKDTDYFRFYNSLINDERLLSVMREYGYTGCFYLHPVFEAQFEDFQSSELITVGNGVADYQKVFRESALMITDYSSVAFDFAYLKKPVIYSQFDEESFYQNHSWGKGYFTYREDGFGPITTSVDETVDTLIDYIKHDCQMREEYVKKVDDFFAYTDRNNRKRIYDAIMEIAEEK